MDDCDVSFLLIDNRALSLIILSYAHTAWYLSFSGMNRIYLDLPVANSFFFCFAFLGKNDLVSIG